MLVPKSLRNMFMFYFHDGSLGVHLGMTKTFHKIKQQFFWPHMEADIKQYVRVCEVCERTKPFPNCNVRLHAADVAEQPLQRLFLDFMGPIVCSRSGNMVILSVCDGFTKFVWLFPMRKISAKTVVDTLQIHLFGCFGIPESVVTDNASVFRSKVFRDMCFHWGIRAVNTSPYYPRGSHVERVHRNLKAALIAYHHDQHRNWDQNLHLFQFGFNTAYHESTKTTPARLFLARDLNHPLELNWRMPQDQSLNLAELEREWKSAMQNLKKSKDRVAERYNANWQSAKFSIGDLVLVKQISVSSKAASKSGKLDYKWSKPRKISRYLSPVTS